MPDPAKNFAKCIVSGTYSSAATAITLQTGEGAKLPQPSTDGAFNLVWWNYTDYPDPSADPNKEIVRCTARTSDALTVTRPVVGNNYNNEDTTNAATAKNTAAKTYMMMLAFTKKDYEDLIRSEVYIADTAANDTYLVAPTPAYTAYVTGMRLNVKVVTANTGAATLNANSLGAKSIVKDVSTALDTGDILAGQIITVQYDGTNFVITSARAGLMDLANAQTVTGVKTFGASKLDVTTPIIRVWDGWEPVSDSWSYSSVDGATGIVTVPSGAALIYAVGMRVKFTQTTVKYFIVTAVTDTTLTLYGGTDYTLANAAISAISFSTMKSPLGFPMTPAKWNVTVIDSTNRSASITAATWTNIGTTNAQITVPIGVWRLKYQVNGRIQRGTSGTDAHQRVTLHTTNSSFEVEMTSYHRYGSNAVANTSYVNGTIFSKEKTVTLAAKTLYYLNAYHDGGGTWAWENDIGSMILEAVCVYL
tara:strand:- start:580 stop:2007 length:1428 start_codon:yes stop_codon:yes gene_type:complete